MLNYFSIPYKNNGRDFEGCDCYGLVLLLAKENGMIFPDYIFKKNYDEDNENVYKNELNNKRWVKCEPTKGAVVVIRIENYIRHVGYMINDINFLHIQGATGVNQASIKDVLWKDRIVGFWKYEVEK